MVFLNGEPQFERAGIDSGSSRIKVVRLRLENRYVGRVERG